MTENELTRETLELHIDDILSYIPRLKELIPEQTGIPEDAGHHKVIGSPAPWNDQAAGVYFDIHAGARHHERALAHALWGKAWRRSNSDHATIRILRKLPSLILVRPQLPQAKNAARALSLWGRSARAVLDDDPHPDDARYATRAPGDLRCPYCNRRLVLMPGWQHEAKPSVWCKRCPETADQDREWPSAEWLGLVLGSDTA